MVAKLSRLVAPGAYHPIGVEWLKRRKLWRDPYEDGAEVLTFWDSLEHIEDPVRILECCDSMAIISIPIFKDKAHTMRSKHFRTDEHFWYFTSEGLIRMMHNEGFRLVDQNDLETKLGREDIRSFVFQRWTRGDRRDCLARQYRGTQ